MDFTKKHDNPSPEERTNIISQLLYCWLFPIFKYGYKNDLETKDLYNTAKCDYSEQLANSLESNWEKEIARAKEKDEPPELQRAIRVTFIKSFSFYGASLLFQALGIRMTQPIILAALIREFEEPRDRMGYKGWLLAMGIVLMAFFNIVIMHHSIIGLRRIGMRVRVAISSLIYRKLLRLNRASIAHTAAGQVINLLSNDVNRFDIATELLHYIWIMPIATVVAGCVMYDLIGYSALVGIFAMALQAVPLQGYLSRLQGKYRFKIANCTDGRVQLMNEITSGIQVIKMYAWEKPFQALVAQSRKIEIDLITKTSYIRGVLVGMMVFTERFTLYLTVITFVLAGNKLTGDKVFATAQLFNTIQLYMVILYPLGISFFAEAKSSVKRIEIFLNQEEFTSAPIQNDIINDSKDGTIKIANAKASWLKNPIIDTLSYINLDINPGTLCAVVGQVGSGKSSLLQMLLKELPLNSGHLEISGTISYASQEPWLFVSTIRNNILFGQPFNKKRYTQVVQVCALERDFELFPNKDHTLVGEKGVSLSGGQRARINLARAVYREADIYLFDDPLSAVDTHVGKHLFEECILKYLGDKTRILVTHQLQFLKHVDQIVILNNGQIDKVGPYNQLADKELNYIRSESENDEVQKDEEVKQRARLMSVASYSSAVEEDGEEPEETQELMEKGSVSGSLYMAYLREGGSVPFLIFFGFMFIIAQVACNASDIWLTRWTNDEELKISDKQPNATDLITNGNSTLVKALENILNETLANQDSTNDTLDEFSNLTTTALEGLLNLTSVTDASFIADDVQTLAKDTSTTNHPLHSQNTYIYVYTVLIILSILLILNRSFIFFKICMNASKGLHNTMFGNVLRATMRFFDTNPSGRILNRFSKDMGIVDEMLPRATLDAMQIFMVMLGILIMVFIVTPLMIIPTSILTVILFFVKNIYLASAQDIKRLEGITKSPAFSHVTASLSGLTTIRASDAQAMIIKEFDRLQDQHSAAWFLFLATSEAFGFYLDVISLTFIAIVTFQFVIFDDGTTLAGEVGLAISQSLILTGMIQYGMRQTAEVTSQMISVERIIQYMHLDKEGPLESTPTKKPNRDWPKLGKVDFNNVSLSYIPDEPPILNNLNFSIQPGEKVGIVGRTGAGKSSLIAALFRLAPTEGAVLIDDVNIADIGLYDLRSKISIIPQEPVLFSESVRHNLDPVNKSEDAVLWKAIENVELKDAIENLNQEINEGGSNFSVGQRQLVCLARAIIRNNKILVMDEATANVDPQTDALIQTKIRENFKDCTVLTIAHRLNTVIDSDRVLVMEAGRAVEFGHPHELLQDPKSFLSKMVKETGHAMEQKLRETAEGCYKKIPQVTDNDGEQITNKKND